MAHQRNVDPFDPQQAAAMLEALSLSDTCPRCNNPVYHAERRIAGGRSYHPTCYTCRACGASLDARNVAPSPDEVFCKTCYGRVRGPRGYGFGMGGKGVFSMTMTAMQVDGLDEVIHNPAMMGAIELEEATRRAEQTRHKSHEEGAGRNLLKTAAHDHILTSNAANTALAYAWPLINKSPPSPSLQTETVRRENARTNDSWPPNTIAAVPQERIASRHARRASDVMHRHDGRRTRMLPGGSSRYDAPAAVVQHGVPRTRLNSSSFRRATTNARRLMTMAQDAGRRAQDDLANSSRQQYGELRTTAARRPKTTSPAPRAHGRLEDGATVAFKAGINARHFAST